MRVAHELAQSSLLMKQVNSLLGSLKIKPNPAEIGELNQVASLESLPMIQVNHYLFIDMCSRKKTRPRFKEENLGIEPCTLNLVGLGIADTQSH